jgi:hypothetical protein
MRVTTTSQRVPFADIKHQQISQSLIGDLPLRKPHALALGLALLLTALGVLTFQL